MRKRVANYKTYKLRECIGLFGFDLDSTNDGIIDEILTAERPEDVIHKHHRQWMQKNKMKHRRERTYWTECAYRWGEYMIIDENGFKTFWR